MLVDLEQWTRLLVTLANLQCNVQCNLKRSATFGGVVVISVKTQEMVLDNYRESHLNPDMKEMSHRLDDSFMSRPFKVPNYRRYIHRNNCWALG